MKHFHQKKDSISLSLTTTFNPYPAGTESDYPLSPV